jgi:hypothetical protein
MTQPALSYILGFSITSGLDDEQEKSFIRSWVFAHAEDHLNMYSILNNLELSLGLPAFEMNQYQLFFDPSNTGMVNDFVYFNNKQHRDIYGWLNSLGAQLANYSKPTQSFVSVLNPTTRMFKIDKVAFNQYFLQKRDVHNTINVAINSLYAAFGQ